MKKLLVAFLAIATVVALAGCVNVTVVKSAESSDGSSSAESAGSEASTSASSAASSAASSSASSSSATPTNGTPQITMGDMGMIDVHGTDAGVGADVVIQVTNTGNVPLVMSAPYIKIADESGKVIVDEAGNGIMTGPSFLRVGDTGFIYTSGALPLPAGYFPGYNYLAQGSADLTACKEVYEYPLSNVRLTGDSNGVPELTGTVTNDDTETATLIEISVVYMDNDNRTLGVASTSLVNLSPGEQRNFTIDGYTLPVGCTMAVISQHDEIAVGAKY